MELVISILFKMIVYGCFGLVLELIFSAIKKAVLEGWNDETKKLEGSVSLWMIPVYAIFLLFIFEPILGVIIVFPAWIRYLVWMLIFPTVEFLVGLFYDKMFNLKPWDYSDENYNLMGYTKLTLLPWWGACGLIIESYSGFLSYLSKTIIIFFI